MLELGHTSWLISKARLLDTSKLISLVIEKKLKILMREDSLDTPTILAPKLKLLQVDEDNMLIALRT